MNFKTIVKSTLVLAILFEAVVIASPAIAACRPNGLRVNGIPQVICRGATRCLRTGRTITVKGRKYPILRCPNRR